MAIDDAKVNSMPRADSHPLPLAGIRVLDLSGETAPICGQMLTLFGADVVLAERGPSRNSRTDFAWLAANADKRSLSLEEAGSADVLSELCRVADVVIDGDPGIRWVSTPARRPRAWSTPPSVPSASPGRMPTGSTAN